MEGQLTRGTGYKVGDLVRIKLDANEIKKRGKKLAKVYSEKYMVYEVIGGGWTYRLKPYGKQGRMKVRHFNDLKDAIIRGTEIESSDEEVLADIKRRISTSRHEDKRQKSTREPGNNKSKGPGMIRKAKRKNRKAKVTNRAQLCVVQPGSGQQRRGYS